MPIESILAAGASFAVLATLGGVCLRCTGLHRRAENLMCPSDVRRSNYDRWHASTAVALRRFSIATGWPIVIGIPATVMLPSGDEVARFVVAPAIVWSGFIAFGLLGVQSMLVARRLSAELPLRDRPGFRGLRWFLRTNATAAMHHRA